MVTKVTSLYSGEADSGDDHPVARKASLISGGWGPSRAPFLFPALAPPVALSSVRKNERRVVERLRTVPGLRSNGPKGRSRRFVQARGTGTCPPCTRPLV